MAVTNAVSWRSEGIKYKKNEVRGGRRCWLRGAIVFAALHSMHSGGISTKRTRCAAGGTAGRVVLVVAALYCMGHGSGAASV